MKCNYVDDSKSLNDLYCVKRTDLYNKYNSYDLCSSYKIYYDENYSTCCTPSYCSSCNPENFTLDSMGTEISHICHDEYSYFFNKPNVVGVGLGFKVINGYQTNQECISVYVDKKISNNFLTSYTIIPHIYRGIPTDVIESGTFNDLRSLKDTIRPALGGCAIGPSVNPNTGTLGCLVQDSKGLYLLSNNHVLSNYNNNPIGTPIVQPSINLGGTIPNNVIANLSRYFPLRPMKPSLPDDMQPTNEIDAAIATIIDPSLLSSSIASINKPPQGIIGPVLNALVKKVGCSSGLSFGKILSINSTVESSGYLYVNQMIALLVSRPGDSGALVVDEKDRAMGLFKGGASETMALINPIIPVLQLLDVLLVTN